jgi:hypothetical protein
VAQLGEQGDGRSRLAKAVGVEVAPSEMKGEREVAQLGGDRVEGRVVRRLLRPELAQQRHALRPRQDVQAESLDPERRIPFRPPASDQHSGATGRRPPAREKGRLLAVVEDQQPRQRALPGGEDKLHLIVLLQDREIRPQVQRARAAAGDDLSGHDRGIGAADPEDTAREEAPVAVRQLNGELRLADATKPRRGGDLTDRRGAAAFEHRRQGAQLLVAPNEERIACVRHAGTGGKSGRRRHAVERQRREKILGGRQRGAIGRPRRDHLVGDDRRRPTAIRLRDAVALCALSCGRLVIRHGGWCSSLPPDLAPSAPQIPRSCSG